ncbi:MAG: pyruvate dehydrogenase (acetyl-transferring), homodimeric type [Leptospiraceae bacterium]|nr:pyruvate dehydrogenase (acetyl-transferring), homodimeric type [Leptospiraceae bacterium]MCP5493410.1 pyruvate dehydrogenase (acetyl-transferring), homodimeric type [Leptospiraceae bacterium]
MTQTNQHLLQNDSDPEETRDWIDSIESIIEIEGPERAHFILEKLIDKARRSGAYLPFSANTAYVNTIPVNKEDKIPGDVAIEKRISSLIRWNAMAMVVQANRSSSELGGHIASYASAATLYDVGFLHFFHAPSENHGGDLVFIQGHSAPGIYSLAFLEGRLSDDDLHKFRQEVDGGGLSSYPHPWLMPNFWQFPTVSMGLGPIQAIYQARFMKYLNDREISNTQGRKVWAFMGDGESDEPESLGAISLAGREKLDNLVFVVNCNLQRLDGPVRGNGKIIQELEGVFRGAGWNVIKVIWGSYWDKLFLKDKTGILYKRMEEALDGDYQTFRSRDAAYVREHFFGKYPELLEMVANMSDEDIWRLNRGGLDPHKVYAAYSAAMKHTGQPTVILAKTIKGFGMGIAGEGQNITHQQKKMGDKAIRSFRDRFNIPISDDEISEAPFYKPAEDSPEIIYLKERRKALGGSLPARTTDAQPIKIPELNDFAPMLQGTEDRTISSTMAFVKILTHLLKDPEIGKYVVPIIPDEARTFGMEGLFRQFGIYSSVGQLYTPQDRDQVMYYKEDKKGQILEEGINEAGAFSSWIAAGTAYSNYKINMIPFYIFYSMFGFQRIGDLAYAAGDIQAKGFLLGGTSGRTTLAGEGLQHQDGHSHLLASTIPNCISYDPTYSYELAVIIQNGLKRMYGDGENIYYYITVMNENYEHPDMPEGSAEGILKGMYLFKQSDLDSTNKVQLLGCGSILNEVIAAAEILEKDFQVAADIWSVTSFNELRREGMEVERWNMLHPEDQPKHTYVHECLVNREGPVIASTDYMKVYADQIRAYVPAKYVVLGADGYGRSDTRKKLRQFFEVDRYYVVIAALKALADMGHLPESTVSKAIQKFNINADKPNPLKV